MNTYHDLPYLGLLKKIRTEAGQRSDRTGVGTFGLFGEQLRYDLSKGFPLLTTKKTNFRSIVIELLWILSGSTNEHVLRDQKVNIWKEWADEDGNLGPVYGKQWRSWDAFQYCDGRGPLDGHGDEGYHKYPIDQIAKVIKDLQERPFDRGHIVNAWNVADIPDMRLRPCHCMFQFRVEELTLGERVNYLHAQTGVFAELSPDLDKREAMHEHLSEQGVPKLRLDCQLYQRSADIFLGVPFNMASYALLTTLIAQQVGMVPGHFIHTFGDVHIYRNHLEQVDLQLSREPYASPTVKIAHKASIDDYTLDDFTLMGYVSHDWIPAPVAV